MAGQEVEGRSSGQREGCWERSQWQEIQPDDTELNSGPESSAER